MLLCLNKRDILKHIPTTSRSEVSVLLEEWLHILNVHSVVHVGVEFESGCLQHLVSEAAVVDELGVFLVVVAEAGDLAALPGEVAQEVGAVHAAQEEESVVHHRPLRDVLELHGISCLHHLFIF
jgi:hypothetical protein